MKYSIEKIYKDYGQFDKIVTLSFFQESPSFNEYPDLMTGTFLYSPKESAQMEEMIQTDISTKGQIRFKEVLNEVNKDQKRNLIRNGINCDEISNIFFLPELNQENEYKSKGTRKLPKPNIIEIDVDDNFDYDSMLLNLNERKLSSGYILIPEETAENIGTKLICENKDIEEIEKENEELKVPIKKHYLKNKLRRKKATEKEEKELRKIESDEIAYKISLLRTEIQKAGISIKNFEKIRPQIETLIPLLLEFKEKRLTHGKFPIWLNYERFLHIFLEHVNETNLGGNFRDKSRFQYLIDDIFRLIEIVLDSIEEEIQKHYTEKTGKNFKRHGEMAVAYKGDYYVIDINPEGLLMTFYKRK
ncbi:MAG: hypothetical protein GY834_16475 [Bacteroidetes bacterium]|nr:hypothetical protein [Bacteroidota bacterium]